MASLPHLDPAMIRDIRRGVAGQVIVAGDPGYEEARRVWNGMIDRRPAVIVRCRSSRDVATAISAARSAGLEIAVRGGGHNVAGLSSVDGGLVIDLSTMNSVTVDVDRRRALVGGGALLSDLDAATTAVGLATTGGMVSHTGVGGLTLGGGYGWLARVHGLACDNVVGAEVVTADGRILRAEERENPELFWGLRGGGGNFGVVTSFEFRLHPVPPVISTGDVFFDLEDAPAVLRTLLDVAPSLPDTILLSAGITTGRSDHNLPDDRIGKPVLVVYWGFLGEAQAARALVAPIIGAGTPVKELPGEYSYVELQRGADENMRPAQRVYWKASFVSTLSGAGIEALVTRGAPDGVTLAGTEIVQLGGAIARVGEDETAYSHREAAFDFLAISAWEDPAEDDARIADVRRAWSTVAPHALSGVYVNNLGDEGADRVRAAYGAEKYARLQAIKHRYDPENVFHRNANIVPATHRAGAWT